MSNSRVYVSGLGAICSLGRNMGEISASLFSAQSAAKSISTDSIWTQRYAVPVGDIKTSLPSIDTALHNTRNNRLVLAAIEPVLPDIEQLKARYGRHRIGLVVGTSTSGIAESEDSMKVFKQTGKHLPEYAYSAQEFSAPAKYMSELLDINGPAWAVSTACTSGGKALAMAARLLKIGACDAVIAGGVDSLCRMTIEGFASLGVTSNDICLPFSKNRAGINIGEAAAFFVLSREESDVSLEAYGETSDAYHISSPQPEGSGAIAAMQQALAMADIEAGHIDYLNLHGTATTQNDAMEALAVQHVLGNDVSCSSTKSLTGHTLAAAGALEALFSVLALQRGDGAIPVHLWDNIVDPDIPALSNLGKNTASASLNWAMSNSFAFGGNNISLIFKRT